MTRIVHAGLLLALWLTIITPRWAASSLIQLPHVSGRDGGLSGNVVALPTDGGSILFFNPAGVVNQIGTEALASIEQTNVTARYINRASGFDATSSADPTVPVLWVRTDTLRPYYLGVGVYGAVGAAFKFAGNANAGIPGRLLGEFSTAHLGLVAGREIIPGLRVGIQVAPSYGMLKARTPSPLGNVELDLSGVGILGSVGVLYDLDDRATFGVAYRSPGVIWMGGDGKVGGQPDRIDLDFRIPQNVTFGFAYRFCDRLVGTAQARWTNYSQFEDAEFRFDRSVSLDQPFIADARSTFRYGLGAEYHPSDWIVLRTGYSYEDRMIGARALRPMLFDTADHMVMAGFGTGYGAWAVDFHTGVLLTDDRVVTAGQNPFFPGRYKFRSMTEFAIAVSRRFNWPNR